MSNRDYLVDIINKQLRHCDLADCRKCSYGGNSCKQAEAIADRLMEAGYPWPQWISVKDGLPEPGEEIIAVANGIAGNVSYHDAIVYAIYDADGIFYGLQNEHALPGVSFWMELPDPPEERQKQPGTNHERYIADYVRDASVEEVAALFAGVASSVAEGLHAPNEEDFCLVFETFLRTPEKTLLEKMREVSNARTH